MISYRGLRAAAGGQIPRLMTFLQYTDNTANQSSYTFTASNLGAEASDREIIVCAFGYLTVNSNVSGITLGGNAMTLVTRKNTVTCPVAIYRISVPTGTSADVVVTFGASAERCGIAMYSITGYGTVTTYDTFNVDSSASSNIGGAMDRVAGGSVVCISVNTNNTARTVNSSNGFANVNVNTLTESTSRVFSGHSNSTTSTVNFSFAVSYSGSGSLGLTYAAATFT